LIRESAKILLDRQAHSVIDQGLRRAVENSTSDRISDLHVRGIGHNIHAAKIAIVTDDPGSPEYYKALIPKELNIVHVTVEVHRYESHKT